MTNTRRLLELALKGLEAERTKLDDEIVQVKKQLNHRPGTGNSTHLPAEASATAAAPKKKRKMSAEARKRISEGMKRRYAELRKAAKTR